MKTMNKSTDETAIRTVIEEWAAAVRRRDMEAILRDHAEDIVMFDVPPPLESRGADAYKTTWGVFFRWTRDPVAFDIQRLEIFAGEEIAFAVALMRCAGKEPDGTDLDLDFRLTVGLRKIGGRWTVVHEHHSIPAES
jgi:ketosteroid isomerase-like protein